MTKTLKTMRIVTFVPAENAVNFAKEIASHIPHICGEYDSVCWWSEPKMEAGTEQFRPLGSELQQIRSVRMEFSIPDDNAVKEKFINKINALHPWKKPVILVYEAGFIPN